ncbi:hypothetical protein GCM10022409_08180 [Hymenobacter glaciei]|uniref:Uncharacterized protein n=1 Tax=Hymenobacter glaciei TaxID=877209 RepID=A0ABP7TIA4_9BACT
MGPGRGTLGRQQRHSDKAGVGGRLAPEWLRPAGFIEGAVGAGGSSGGGFPVRVRGAAAETEGIYRFARYTDEGALTVCPATNTLAHLATQLTADLPDAKLEPAEWRYESAGAPLPFDASCHQLRPQVLNETLAAEAFEPFRQQRYPTCPDVVADLPQPGFFDPAAGREVLLLFHVADRDPSAQGLAQLVSRPNPNAYGTDYLAWLRTWEG